MKYRAEYSDVCGYWVVLNEEKHFALGGYSKEKAHLKAEELNAKEVIEELYQCPYNEACKCRLDEACLYCETFGEYLNQEAKERVDSVLPDVEIQPYCCPVCNGSGLVENGFYRQVGGNWISSDATPEKCRSCDGTGIVWDN